MEQQEAKSVHQKLAARLWPQRTRIVGDGGWAIVLFDRVHLFETAEAAAEYSTAHARGAHVFRLADYARCFVVPNRSRFEI